MTTVFITGAARGIGLALAKSYAATGATVFATVRDEKDQQTLSSIAHEVFIADVRDAASFKKVAQDWQGRAIDVLINNAGIIGPEHQTALDMDYDGFLQTLDVNTIGPLRVTQALLGNITKGKNAKVAIISSRMGALSVGGADRVAYRASKAAANKVSQGLAEDLKSQGVAVASFHPGWVRTDMGGSNADIDPATSADGIRDTLEGLALDKTGKFWSYDGSNLPW